MKIIDYDYPEDRLYLINKTPSHLWFLKINEGKNIYLIGLTDFFQKQIGQINKITLKKPGETISSGKTMGLVQAEKYSAILKTPITVKIVEVNSKVMKKPKIINEDPYNSGWIYKVEIDDENSLNNQDFVQASNSALEQFITKEKESNALIGDDCCPDFLGKSGVVRRKKK